MAASQTDVQLQTIRLSTEAFEAFCEDVSGMFGVGMGSSQKEPYDETVSGLSEKFKKLVAVNTIKSEGALDGKFQIVFDKKGLFTLAGVIVMLPEEGVLKNCKSGSTKEAEDMSDAIGEAGNLLIGSCDKIFREGLKDHGSFVQTDTFVGDPWSNPEEKIGLAKDEEFLFVPYELTVSTYPAFNCGVILPKTIFGDTSESEPETTAVADEEPVETAEETASGEEAEDEKPVLEGEDAIEQVPESATEIKDDVADDDTAAPEETEAKGDVADDDTAAPEETETKGDIADTATSEEADVESEQSEEAESDEAIEPATGPVSETIQKMVHSPADLPAEAGLIPLPMCAKDIMQSDILWGSSDDSVEQALAKMQQADTGYLMIGTEGLLEHIVSTFDIASAISVYLKPMFVKWRRPIDDATLLIKLKWIMTKPALTVNPDTSIANIMENMRRFDLRCLPVVDEVGKAAGFVTVFDVFNALLNTGSEVSTTGKTPQASLLT